MTRVGDLFRNDIARTIEEVVKVDVLDDAVVASEISEYVVTDRIRGEFEDVVREYVDCLDDRSDRTNVWVSGFFGSGKSSFAKVLGYLLENRVVAGRSVAERFFERADSPVLQALLGRAHDAKNQGTAITVLLDLSSAHDVEADEHILLPVYRAVLQRLGYAREPNLAALEFDLETDGRLDTFISTFESVHGKPWDLVRHTTLAPNMASRVLHEIDPATFPMADSWAKGFAAPTVDANWFARRAIELVERRGHGARRLVLVVDETGQYVSHSRDRMLALQGLAEAVQKQQGRIFLIATSQERLEEVVDSLAGKVIELARVKARFPVPVDLTASDIREVVSKRLLDKSDAGRRELVSMVMPVKEQLAANLRLHSDRRADEFAVEEVVRLYPLLPYQVQLLIDAVTQRRSQLRAGAPLGGSNRTIIQHTQQLLSNPRVGLADEEVGALVTIDRSYDLLTDVIDTGLRHQVDQVAADFPGPSVEVQIMKVVALVHGVRSLPLSAQNLAVLLHPNVHAESIRPQVEAAAQRLVVANWLRESEGAYLLQSPEQKLWDEKRQMDPRPGDQTRERRRILKDAVAARLSVTEGRVFKIGLIIDGERVSEGEVVIDLTCLDPGQDPGELVPETRERTSSNRIVWWYRENSETTKALNDAFMSRVMVDSHAGASMSDSVRELVAEERGRQRRAEAQFLERVRTDLDDGRLIFHGVDDAPPPGTLIEAMQAVVRDRLGEVYPHLEVFAARIDGKTPLEVARTDDLSTLPASLGDDGIRLYTMTPAGPELVVDRGAIQLLVEEVRRRDDYGEPANGQYLERHFGAAPYGAAPEVVQAVTAAALRAGLIEITHQGQRIASVTDRRLDNVFRGVAPFRSATVRPPSNSGPDLATRSRLAERITDATAKQCPVALDELAARTRELFGKERQPVGEAVSFLQGVGLAVPSSIESARRVLESFGQDDEYVVSEVARGWDDLQGGIAATKPLTALIEDDPALFSRARRVATVAGDELPVDAHAERDELADLLDAGDLIDHLPKVRAMTERLSASAEGHLEASRAAATADLDELRRKLRSDFEDLDGDVVDAALAARFGPLDPSGASSVTQVMSRQARFADAAATVQADLDAVRSEGRIVRLDVASAAASGHSGPITDADELDKALDAVRAHALALLSQDKQVRLT